jgi:CheY-like chemotaxis protein
MRNPLSAIILCGDWIGTSLSEFGGESQNVTIPTELMDSYTDAAQTIVLCAQHQKRIIDDILTLSKLDSDLLLVTPVEAQPLSVIQMALKMFDSELQKNSMELRLCVDPSYSSLAVDWVRLDPSRLLQVLINLTTNAIKFTQTQTEKKISINIGASREPPLGRNGIEFLPRSSNCKDLSLGSDWGTGEIIYLYVEVEDSGRGLDEDEKNLLFRRFSQTSTRTHVQYGGSGLGLFISRELTELQGGQIGVASQVGIGSTFAFYLRARRCDPPQEPKSFNAYPVDMKAHSKIISPAALARLQNGSSLPRAEGKAAQPVPPKHVLIVEDNIINQKVLSKQLRSAGCTVHVANHGGEALTFLSTTRFWAGNEANGLLLHIILMDLEMPVMDGLACVKEIRQLQREGVITSHIPVIAITANARNEQIAIAKESGMDSVVTKPFRLPELLPEMERQVNKEEARPEELERPSSAPL